mmetsp:Transcript_28253/g.45403  ORF Transcript_28253/g.45403 Transcript_28253/m.45403 type:complete len:215 (+) Transcript_28253:2717-3361(+)
MATNRVAEQPLMVGAIEFDHETISIAFIDLETEVGNRCTAIVFILVPGKEEVADIGLANKRARWRPGHRGRGADSDPGTGHTGPNRVEGTHTRLHAGPWPQTLDFAPRLGPLMHLHAAPPRFHLHLANLRLGSWTPRAPMTPSVCTMCRAAVGRQLALVGRVAYFYLVLSDGGSAPFWGVPAELDKVFAFARHDRLVWFCRLGRSSTKRNSPAV